MTPEAASRKKTSGHQREAAFARLIGGNLHGGGPRAKTDVVGADGTTYSVKSAKWWQVFLYGLRRFRENTEFRDIGGLAQAFVDCIEVFPDEEKEGGFDAYKADKWRHKERLRAPMRRLKGLLSDEDTLRRFLAKALLDGDRVEFMAVEVARSDSPVFHLFDGEEFVEVLTRELHVENSVGRGKGQVSEQKVLLRYRPDTDKPRLQNVGEIELRNDSPGHYREMKFRMNGHLVMAIMKRTLGEPVELGAGIIAFGRAASSLEVEESGDNPRG